MAIQAPTYRERTVRQQAIPNVRQQIDTPAAAFGSAQAEAITNSGTAAMRLGAQWGKQAINLQDETNELYALQLQTQAEKEISDFVYNPETGLMVQKGRAALDAPNMMATKMAEIQKRFDETKNIPPEVRNMLQKSMIQMGRRYGDLAGRHALGEYGTFKAQTLQAKMELNMQDVSMNYMDDAHLQAKAKESFELLQSRATSEGWGQEQLDAEKLKLYSGMRSAQIDGMLRSGDPSQIVLANSVMNEAYERGQFWNDDYVRLQQNMKTALPSAAAKIEYGKLSQKIGGSAALQKAVAVAEKNGVDPEFAAKVAIMESNGNPYAKNPKSSAGGMYQFIDGTAERYKLDDKFDVEKSSEAFTAMTKVNKAYLEKKLGRPVSNGELYLAHQQGEGGAAKLLSASPMTKASAIVGSKAVKDNGGTADMTAQEFANLWIMKYENTQIPTERSIDGISDSVYARANALEAQYPGSGAELVKLYDKDLKFERDQRTQAKNESQDEVSDYLTQNNGDYTNMPMEMRMRAVASGVDVTAFKGYNDPAAQTQLDAMSTAELLAADLNAPEYVQNLDFATLQAYRKKQTDLRTPENSKLSGMVDDVVDYYFRQSTGKDPSDKKQKEKVAAMRNHLLLQASNKKDATPADFNKWAAEYIPNLKRFDLSIGTSIRDIPDADRKQIEANLISQNRPVTEAAIINIWITAQRNSPNNQGNESNFSSFFMGRL